MRRKVTKFMCDFETTVYEGQQRTDVWASACVPFWTEDVKIFHSIDEQFDYFESLSGDILAYYHNLKFDGEFWLSFLMNVLGFTQAYVSNTEDEGVLDVSWQRSKDMPVNSFSYSISSMGQWYRVTIRTRKHVIELRDSLKLLPFSVKHIGKSFGTKHKKLEMEYEGFRYPGCEITDEERAYIANDVLVVKEALEIMFSEGHEKLTIGACCLEEFKHTMSKSDYQDSLPDLYAVPLDKSIYGQSNMGDYIRGSYHGGWCYLVPSKSCRLYRNGTTADVNSLYPSMMSSESGNAYPYGEPTFWRGNYIPEEALKPWRYYFVRVRTRFYIKDGMLPTIQIKNNPLYSGREWLTSSDVRNVKTGELHRFCIDRDGNIVPTTVTMTMTMTDFEMMLEHYDLEDFEILDGCWFYSRIGIFDKYISKYSKIKMESKGARRTLAKLFLNNLYGKMAASTNSSFKVADLKEDGSVHFQTVYANDKKPGYIPVGSAITSYARRFTITAAQANYHGPDNPGFIYADTDSIHCDLQPDEIVGVPVDPVRFCRWKLESSWDEGWFVRAKTYMEHVTANDLVPVEEPYWDVKCAGMPDRCKRLYGLSMSGDYDVEGNPDGDNEEELKFVSERRGVEDFKTGLVVPGKLVPRHVPGGVLLCDTPFTMRG